MALRDEVRDLLELARTWPVTVKAVVAHLTPRARAITHTDDEDDDCFVELAGDVATVEVYNHEGVYAELAVTRGTLAELAPLLGPLAPIPTNPGDLRGHTTLAVYPVIDGRRLRVFVEHIDGAVKKVTIHFET